MKSLSTFKQEPTVILEEEKTNTTAPEKINDDTVFLNFP